MRLFLAMSALLLGHQVTSGPALHALPSVVGTARAGSQITGTSGTWTGSGTVSYSYRWDRCDAAGDNCAQISGAALPTYGLTSADVGKTLGLVVTAKDSTGTVVADANLIGPIASSGALANIGRPLVAGTAAVGSELNVTEGIWTTTPAAVTYSWLRCNIAGRACVAIAGASAATYVPIAADVGHTLVARVQGTLGTAFQVVLSVATGVVVQGKASTTTAATTTAKTSTTAAATTTAGSGPGSASTRPTISGTVRAGQRLAGTASGATAYQWYRCDTSGAHCNSIHGAVKSTYTEVAKDVGQTIALTVMVNGSASYTSLVGPVAASKALASTVQPTLIGRPQQGQTLTASAGTFSAASSSVTYAWERCNPNGRICTPITGATSSTYSPVADDVGHALVAVVTATAAGKTQSAFSVATDAIAAPPVLAATTPPIVTGTAEVGQQLASTTGVWAGTAPIVYAFQWYRCDAGGAHCLSVHGATKATYKLVAADAGKTIAFTVNATDATGTKQPAYSSLLGPVASSSSALAATAQPKVTVNGQALTVDSGTWTAKPTSTTVQWERCNANGRICVAIAAATSGSYTATSADTGHELVALVTAHAGTATATAFSVAVKVA
jgi:Ig domain of plant-specific actin-binding protein